MEYIGGEDPSVGSPVGSKCVRTISTVSASSPIEVQCEHDEWLEQRGTQIEFPTTLLEKCVVSSCLGLCIRILSSSGIVSKMEGYRHFP
jgi:hypothetical protein